MDSLWIGLSCEHADKFEYFREAGWLAACCVWIDYCRDLAEDVVMND